MRPLQDELVTRTGHGRLENTADATRIDPTHKHSMVGLYDLTASINANTPLRPRLTSVLRFCSASLGIGRAPEDAKLSSIGVAISSYRKYSHHDHVLLSSVPRGQKTTCGSVLESELMGVVVF